MNRFTEGEVINLVDILRDSLDLAKNNIIVIIPSVIVSIVMLIFAMVLIGGSGAPVGTLSSRVHDPQLLQGLFFLSCISLVLQVFSQGMIISMVNDLIKKGTCSLRNGLNVTFAKLNDLMIAAFILLFTTFIGMILLIFPAIIVGFLFMFTIVIIITEDIDAIEAMKKSCFVVKENLSQCVQISLVLVGTGFLLGLINALFVQIPVLGGILFALLAGVYISFIAIMMTKFYRKLNLKRTE